MATRLIDFPALWSSDKLFRCAADTRCEYAWLYGLADAHGSFELTNLRVIHGRVAPIREDLTLEKLGQCVKEFNEHGLLFVWQQDGKRYGHWTNSEGRLPSQGHRSRYVRFAPPVPEAELQAYLARFLGSNPEQVRTTSGGTPDNVRMLSDTGLGLGLGLGLGYGEPFSSEVGTSDEQVSERKPSKEASPEEIKLSSTTASRSRHARKSPMSEPEGFAEFWKCYPKKKAKQAALRAWRKLSGVDLRTILAALEAVKLSDDWQKENGQFIPHPATWLNGRRWEDEVVLPVRSNATSQPGPMPQRLLRPELDDAGRRLYERAGVIV